MPLIYEKIRMAPKMLAMPLTQDILETMGCSEPGCMHDHSVLFLHGCCHVKGGSAVSYDKVSGLLTVRCMQCDALVAEILVAARAGQA